MNPISISSSVHLHRKILTTTQQILTFRYKNDSTELRYSDYEDLFQFLPHFRRFQVLKKVKQLVWFKNHTSLHYLAEPFSYPEPYLRAVRRGALAKSKTGNHKNMVKDIYVIRTITFVVANQMPV
jgi:hypothetical protein